MAWFDFTILEQVHLQLASSADATPIALMSRDLIETGLGWSWTPIRVAKHIRNPRSLVVVARYQKRLIGFVMVQMLGEEAHLNLLAVERDYQRLGIGQGMLDFVETAMRYSGIAHMHLEVRAENKIARHFYQVQGYRDMALVPHYYRGREPAIRMMHTLITR